MDDMVKALQGGIDANSTTAPQMSIDPKTSAVSVVGDPNQIDNGPRPYKILFSYPEDEITEEDKLRMKPSEESEGEYLAEVTYENKRVRPIHRTKIAMGVGKIFNDMGLFSEDGSYDSATLTEESARIFLDHIEEIADMARMILEIPDSQVPFIRSDCLVDFFVDMLHNEPNVIKEAASFLGVQSRQRLAKMVTEATAKAQNTQQS